MNTQDISLGPVPAVAWPLSGPETARIVCFHGGGGVSGSPAMIEAFCELLSAQPGLRVIAPAYRTGTGGSGALDGMLSNAVAALEAAHAGLPEGGRLYVLGTAFGAVAAAWAARMRPAIVEGMILVDPVLRTGAGGLVNAVVGEERGDVSPVTLWEGAGDAIGRVRLLAARGTGVQDGGVRRFAGQWPESRGSLLVFPRTDLGFYNRAPKGAELAADIARFAHGEQPKRGTDAPPPRGTLLPEGVGIVYGIGAQKAGTTWLYDYLSGHPEVHLPSDTKEMHYFDTLHEESERAHLLGRLEALRNEVSELTPDFEPFNRRRLQKIRIHVDRLMLYAAQRGDHRPYIEAMLSGRGDERLVCDVTPSYGTLSGAAFADMASIGPARFVFLMREPVARMWSHLRMMVRYSDPDLDDRAFEAACVDWVRGLADKGRMTLLPRANYKRTITELEAAVDPERILYLFHQDPFPQETGDAVCDFLGIARRPVKPGTSNVGRASDLPPEAERLMIEALRPQYDFIAARFGAEVPGSWHARFAKPRAPAQAPASAPARTHAPRAPGFVRTERLSRAAPKVLSRLRGGKGPVPTVAFLHIPKTAGQTVHDELARVAGPTSVSPVRVHTQAKADAQLPPGHTVYSGHIDWTDLETLPEARFAFTVLRDPRERIASFYFYLLREAEKLSQADLALPQNTGKRTILSHSPEDYFFGGDKAWQRFVLDHYDNFYVTYLATRRIRGRRALDGQDGAQKVERAMAGADALDAIYPLAGLPELEADLSRLMGARLAISGSFRNAGPDAGQGGRWQSLADRMGSDAALRRLEDFAALDLDLMSRLGLS